MDIQEKIRETVTTNPVVLFMKGTPQFPQCGFSGAAVQILRSCGVTEFVAVNVLAESQVDLSRRFASSAVADKFADGGWAAGLGGAPVLAGCAAVFECEVASRQVAGDHVLFIGRVLRLADLSVAPLLFQGGHYRMLGEVL